MFGVVADVPIDGTFSVAGHLYYENLYTEYDKNTSRYVYVESVDALVPLDFDLATEMRLSYVSAAVLGKWHPGLGKLFVMAGPSLGVLVSGYVTETEYIRTPGYEYISGGGNGQLTMDGELDRYYDRSSLRFAMLAGAGYDIGIGEAACLTPVISVSIPINPVLSAYPSWRVLSLRAAVQLRVGI